MVSKSASDKYPVAVIGAGSFGTAVANLLAENGPVLFYSRRPEAVESINRDRVNSGQQIHANITATNDLSEIAERCYLMFPSVSSDVFRQVMRDLAPFLRPYHMMIHCTKGFDIKLEAGKSILDKDIILYPNDIYTMSKVILDETCVKRVGCMSGPNLAREIASFHPAATVIASKFDEVIKEGDAAIRSKRLQVFSNHDIYAVELAGVLKNSMALAAGALGGMGYGQNAMAFLITRGMGEIIRLATAMGADKQAFLGLAGIGDLVATCTSPMSRNYTVGARLAKGETLADIIASSTEVAEGIKTVSISKKLADSTGTKTPIIQIIYRVLFEDLPVQQAMNYMMEYRSGYDSDYL